jgi:uncharacterized SAM-binding protein YcdF (DUF218 family)
MSVNEYIKEAIELAIRHENKDYDLPALEIQRLNQLVDNIAVLSSNVKSVEEVVIHGFDSLLGLTKGDNYLLEHEDVIAVVSGGQGTDEPITEAECMYRELVNLGIDPKRIWIEDEATSTWENMKFTLDLIEEKTGTRPEKLGVLSSEYHLFRASLFAKACDVEFVGIPAKTSRASQAINHFMREVAGIWHYILLGGNYD